ncbi:FG-GAP repeat domain-containing protein [Urbifossiella limnaea]|uniref:FG-GAP repeat protein n=1 Tax=Urbifossiella limnaea TaxID=2528023 RepID=A0A517XVD1_9BACT|nr:VCBS repeat-containing protein [Urbifossiella limnaea]QDU21456.1 FG-GAP repeat protein [Urbifossiella limnaea]
MTRRRSRLELNLLEDRVTPVLGGFDVPVLADVDDPVVPAAPIPPGQTERPDFTGVVAVGSGGTGFLLDRGAFVVGSRHIVTAAHVDPQVGDIITFFRRLPDGNLDRVQIPVIEVWNHPEWTGNVSDGVGDVSLVTLAAVAPFGVEDYAMYTAGQTAQRSEIGQTYYMAGFGLTGTGFTGQSNNEELQRITISGNGGQFQLVVQGPSGGPVTTAPLPFNPTAIQIQNALAAIGFNTLVSSIYTGPLAPTATQRSFEILFLPLVNYPRIQFQQYNPDPLVLNGNFGTVTSTTLVNGLIDPEAQRLTIDAAGGNFTLSYGPTATAPIVFDPANPTATADRIQQALQNLGAAGPGEVTVRAPSTGINTGTYQIVFDQIGFDIPLLTANPAGLQGGTGTVKVATIMDGGFRPLRAGSNVHDAVDKATLRSDFVATQPDSSEGQGDSGSAGFVQLADGSLAAISVVSYGQNPPNSGGRIFPFGSLSFNTRLSRYEADIMNQANGVVLVSGVPTQNRYPLTLDMQYQFAGFDGVPDVITVKQASVFDRTAGTNVPAIEVYVRDPATSQDVLYYRDRVDRIDSIRLVGTSDDETFIISPGVSKVVSVIGGFGNDTVVGPDAATAWRFTGAGVGTGDTPTTDFDFQGIENVVGGVGADTFSFTGAASLVGTINGGAGLDAIDTSARFTGISVLLLGASTDVGGVDGFYGNTTGVAAPAAKGFINIDGFTGYAFGGGDTLITPGVAGTFTHNGTGGTYVSATGLPLNYSGVDVLIGGAAADTFNVRSLAYALTIDGGSGDDVVNVAADAPTMAANGTITANLVVRGGAGTDTFRFNGNAANESVTARVVGPQTGDVLGLTPANIQVAFDTLEQFLFDGRGGTNTFTALDISGTSLGTPTDPGSGIVYSPTGPTGGGARINGVTVGGFALGSFTVNGDPDNSGDDDVLTVVGTSAPGLQSAFGEGVVGDGRDRITVTEQQVSFVSAAAGPLLPVRIGFTNGFQTFSTLYVAGGNERGNEGDTFDLPTSLTFNLVADGMLPSPSARPGDRLVLSAPGGSDAQLVTDPSLGPTQVRVTARADGSSAGVLGFESGVPAVPGAGAVVVGSDTGYPSTFRVFDRITGAFRYEVTPFENFFDGLKVASGDVNGDGIADVVVGAGPGGGPRVAAYDGLTGEKLYDFFGYEESFRGGVTVAVGDVDLDGFGDFILGTGPGGGPRVRVISGRDGAAIRDVFPYEMSFRGGVSVAAGDVNGDGVPDLITSAGEGGGPRVVVVDGVTSGLLASFFVFNPNSRAGFSAAGADVNGDGFADVIAGSGAGEQAQVRVFSGINRAVLSDFYINDPFNPGLPSSPIGAGVRVAAADTDGDGVADVVTGLGPGGDAVVRTYKVTGVNPETNALFPTLAEIRRQDAFDVGFNFGIFVGASD